MKFDLRPLLLDRPQRGTVVYQQRRRINCVERDTVRVGIDKFLQLVRIVAGHPARQIELAAQDSCLDTVLVLQPVRDHFKLQLSHRAQQQQ